MKLGPWKWPLVTRSWHERQVAEVAWELCKLSDGDAKNLAVAGRKLAELEQKQIVPGLWSCPRCKFELVRSLMRASDGTVAVNPSAKSEPCPNGCGALEPVTLEQALARAIAAGELHANRASALLQAAEDALTTLIALGCVMAPNGRPFIEAPPVRESILKLRNACAVANGRPAIPTDTLNWLGDLGKPS